MKTLQKKLLLLLLMLPFGLLAQNTLKGVVLDGSSKQPLPGVNVIVQGASNSTTTDFDGNYTIKAKQGEALVITYTGKKPAKIVIAAANSYNVSLKDDVVQGVDVIVVGYGKTSKEAFTGTATQLVKENLEAKTVSNISQAFQWRHSVSFYPYS